MMLSYLLFFTIISLLSSPALSINKRSELFNSGQHARNVRDTQATLNKMIDLAIEAAKKNINDNNEGKWNVLDINEKFSTGKKWWKIKGEFNTKEGTFEDLRSINRFGDGSLQKEGLVYTASCKFGIPEAYLKYHNYKLKYGPIKVDGRLDAKIDGIRILVSYLVDYTKSTCQTALKEVRINEMGDVKVEATGLGSLNHLYSKLVTWVTEKYKDNVVGSIENKLKSALEGSVSNFNCEKYRPLE